MDGLAVEVISSGDAGLGSLQRRGLQIRQPRTINVAKTLAEIGVSEDTQKSEPPKLTSKYQPKMYIPERQRQTVSSGGLSQNGTSSGVKSYGSAAVSGLGHDSQSSSYSSRLSRGRDAPPETSASVLSTSRGLFALRPKRNIRVKSFDELENDSGPSEPPRPQQTPKVQTGFVRDTSHRDNLARRGQHTVTDLLGSRISGPILNPLIPNEPFARTDFGINSGNPDLFQTGAPLSFPSALRSDDVFARTDFALNSDVQDGLRTEPHPSFNSQPHLILHPELESHISHSLSHNYITEPTDQFQESYPFKYDAFTPHTNYPLEMRWPPVGSEMNVASDEFISSATEHQLDSDLDKNGNIQDSVFSNGEYSDVQNDAFHTSFTPSSHDPLIFHDQMTSIGASHSMFLDEPEPSKPVITTSAYNDRIAEILKRQQASLVRKEPENETLDEKKERILRELMQRKMESANALSRSLNPNEETLEQKKERIFANLRQKYASNPEASDLLMRTVNNSRYQGHDILGLSGMKPSYSRSKSFGDALSSNTSDLYPSDVRETYYDSYSQPREDYQPNEPALYNHDQFSSVDQFSESEILHQQSNPLVHSNTSDFLHSRELPVAHEIDPNIQRILNRGRSRYDEFHSQVTAPVEDSRNLGPHVDEAGDTCNESSTPEVRIESQINKESPQSVPTGKSRDNSPITGVSSQKLNSPSAKGKKHSPGVIKPQKTDSNIVVLSSATDHAEDEDSTEETLIRPSDVKAAAGNLLLKKKGPPTKPKTATKPDTSKQATTNSVKCKPPVPQQTRSLTPKKAPLPRPKSAPPNKSKSVANLSEITVAKSPNLLRRGSIMSNANEDSGDDSVFLRSSRLRSSTRAWEIRQAEKQAEIRNRTQSQNKPVTPTKAPGTPRKSVITGQVMLSAEHATDAGRADKPTHTPRASSNYDKPWRTGTTLVVGASAGTFTLRSAQPNALSDRPKKPISNPASGGSSRAASPNSRGRSQGKEEGSVLVQGCARSQTNTTKNSPATRPKTPNKLHQSTASPVVTNSRPKTPNKLSNLPEPRSIKPKTPIKLSPSTSPTRNVRNRMPSVTSDRGNPRPKTPSKITPGNGSPCGKGTTVPKPFKFSYVSRVRRSSTSSDVCSEVGSDLENFLQNEEDINITGIDLGKMENDAFSDQVAPSNDYNLMENFSLAEETRRLDHLARQWGRDDAPRGVSPDSGFSVRTLDSDLAGSPQPLEDKTFFDACDSRSGSDDKVNIADLQSIDDFADVVVCSGSCE